MNTKKTISDITNKGILFLAVTFLLFACREEVSVFIPEEEQVSIPEYTSIQGFYLLNEGNMGSNKSTLDYYDYKTGTYYRNIFGSANPNVAKEMGDVGNDIQIYGSKMYAVINCSNKVEVTDAKTAVKIGQVDIPNCRYVKFHKGYAYVTSYAGPVEIDPDYKQQGYVAKIDTATLQVVDRCLVGFQPDELEIVGSKIYVANSGGYMFPNYENTVSVIDIPTFTERNRIKVAINLHRLCADKHGNLWVSSRGDYYTTPSQLHCIDIKTQQVTNTIDISVSNFHLDGDSLYVYSSEFNYISMTDEITYGIVNVATKEIVTKNFITDGTEEKIKMPYGIAVNPITKDIYVTDAKNYISPGTLYCFDKEGKQKWNVRTGDIPAHMVFLGEIENDY